MWENHGGTNWTLLQLNADDAIGAGNDKWVIKQAHDINNNGWITAYGYTGFGSGFASGVLKPLASCYADCNGDGALNLADFGCFQTKFATGDPYADCNGDTALTVADFGCFQTRFVQGCP